jgi:2-oxoglutarate/2-oxoacid ferredoxin oxidoreductase subunit alpha
MQRSILVRFSGQQGQGVQSVAAIIGGFYAEQGYQVLAVNDYASRIRGGYSFSQILVSTGPARSVDHSAQIAFAIEPKLVEQDQTTLDASCPLFAEGGKISSDAPNVIPINLAELLEPVERRGVNIFYVGLFIGLTGKSLAALKPLLEKRFGKKGKTVVSDNMKIAGKGFAFAQTMPKHRIFLAPPVGKKPAVVRTGSEAIALGAVAAGVKFHAGYPMAPSTAVMNTLVRYSQSHGIVVEQAEDEIAAINLAVGASYAGVRAMTATSGGGLALMGETVSLAAISENPLVIVNVQRPGPATGLPTKTAQADLHMVLNLGHGEFARYIASPGNLEEAFKASQKAFYLAEKYQLPAFVLSDQHLGDSLLSSEEWQVIPEWQKRFIKTESVFPEPTPARRYLLGDSPISPRIIPGMTNDLTLSDSHLHDEFGHITEDPEISQRMQEKLVRKDALLIPELDPLDIIYSDAETLLIGFGSTWGAIRDACERLQAEGLSVGHVHFHEVCPLAEDMVWSALGKASKTILVENNLTAQFARLLRMECGFVIDDSVLKYDGRPFYTDELVSELKGRLQS